MHAGGPLSRKGFPNDKCSALDIWRKGERGGCQDARDATTRPSSWGSDGSSLAMSADQTEGTRMQRIANAAMRKAMSMTNIMREGRGWCQVVVVERDKKGDERCPAEPMNGICSAIDNYVNTSHCGFLSPL
jgi:hypothetical protein